MSYSPISADLTHLESIVATGFIFVDKTKNKSFESFQLLK